MPRFTITAKVGIKIKKKEWLQAYEDFVLEAIQKAGRAFIQSTATNVPVRTGMARGSLMAEVQSWQGSESALSFFGTSVSISPTEYNKKYYIYPDQRNLQGTPVYSFDKESNRTARGWIPKVEESGAALSRYTITKDLTKTSKFTFTFDSGVRHFTYNDFALWHSLEFGKESFQNSIAQSFKKIPKFTDFMEYVRISGGRFSHIQGTQSNRKVSL
jgi:hypothetical protein